MNCQPINAPMATPMRIVYLPNPTVASSNIHKAKSIIDTRDGILNFAARNKITAVDKNRKISGLPAISFAKIFHQSNGPDMFVIGILGYGTPPPVYNYEY